MLIPALARYFPSLWASCVLLLIGGCFPLGKNIQNEKSNPPPHTSTNFLSPLPFLSPLLFQQMSSLFLQWLGTYLVSCKCTRPKWFECLPKDNNKTQHADLRDELLRNQSSCRDKGNRRSKHRFCQYEANGSNYTKPQGNWSNLSADKVSSNFLQAENPESKY